MAGKDYLLEIQKFTTSQYWNSGVRITAGVMIPTLVMIQQGWLSIGIPFLLALCLSVLQIHLAPYITGETECLPRWH
jgi:hypothetical protein